MMKYNNKILGGDNEIILSYQYSTDRNKQRQVMMTTPEVSRVRNRIRESQSPRKNLRKINQSHLRKGLIIMNKSLN